MTLAPGTRIGQYEVRVQLGRLHGRGLPAGAFWMKVKFRLAETYRMGRDGDAEVIEHDLLHLLQSADPDHPLLVRLRRRP